MSGHRWFNYSQFRGHLFDSNRITVGQCGRDKYENIPILSSSMYGLNSLSNCPSQSIRRQQSIRRKRLMTKIEIKICLVQMT